MKYDVYLAGPFFNDEQKAVMKRAKFILQACGLVVADPQEIGPVIVDTPPEKRGPDFYADIFNGNIMAMLRSRRLLACIDWKDIGTAFELGFFYQKHFSGRLNQATFSLNGAKTNVMLSQAAGCHLTTEEEIELWAKGFAFNEKAEAEN